MRDLLFYLVCSLVDHPEAVRVDQIQKEDGAALSLQVGPSDMGKVIGKGGKIIKALRDILRILAVKEGKRANIELKEAVV